MLEHMLSVAYHMLHINRFNNTAHVRTDYIQSEMYIIGALVSIDFLQMKRGIIPLLYKSTVKYYRFLVSHNTPLLQEEVQIFKSEEIGI